jgi:hypothetical protein
MVFTDRAINENMEWTYANWVFFLGGSALVSRGNTLVSRGHDLVILWQRLSYLMTTH